MTRQEGRQRLPVVTPAIVACSPVGADVMNLGQPYRGDRLRREIELLAPTQVTILSERRVFAPYGLNGGENGQKGRSVLIEKGVERELPGKCNLHVEAGAVLRIETSGGGGWGEERRLVNSVQKRRSDPKM